MNRFLFNFSISGEDAPDRCEIDAGTLSEAVTLFLQGQFPDGEAECCCDNIKSFSVERIGA
jgi:hypothetical protein